MKAELAEMAEIWRRSPISTIRPDELMLVTDFDGTLAEIGPDPTRSFALPEALDALRRLVHRLKQVIVLSSRTNDELARLVPVDGVRLIGDSGRGIPSPEHKRGLELFNIEAAKTLVAYPGVWLETKPASTTIHVRNAQASASEVLVSLGPLLRPSGFTAAVGRKVVEVHAPHTGKGSAMAGLLEEVRPGGVVTLGDDENDRPVFELVSGLEIPHLCVGVGSLEVPPDLFERCDLVLSGPHEATSFLRLIAEWATNLRSPGTGEGQGGGATQPS